MNNEFVSDVVTALRQLDYDVAIRNSYMDKRDRYLWRDGLWEGLDDVLPDGFDRTIYNYLPRIVDIHTAQLMGRGFQVYSYFEKQDLSIITDPNQETEMELENKKAKSNADARQKLVLAIIRDNGGDQIFKDGARTGSSYGTTCYKMWWDAKNKKVKITHLESPQNIRVGWKDSNFREYDYVSYVYQVSYDQARRNWKDKLAIDQDFTLTMEGAPLDSYNNQDTTDPLNQRAMSDTQQQSNRQMVTVIDFTGFLPGWSVKGGKMVKVDSGKETELSVLIVGGVVVQIISDPKQIPQYYVIPNRKIPRRAWGNSDLPDAALSINKTILERMCKWITFLNKSTVPRYKGKGFDIGSATSLMKSNKSTVIPMNQEQDIQLLEHPTSLGNENMEAVQKLEDAFVRVTEVGHVLFDDPSVNTGSNQALMTTLKPVLDVVEDKQSRWSPVLAQMFEDALQLAALNNKDIDQIVNDDSDWYLYITWPNVLRREDAAYQTMYLNRFNAGTISVDSYLEAMGTPDTTEELDRIRDNMKDPVSAAILGHGLAEMAHQTLNKALGIPPWGYVIPKVNLKGELTPNQEGNMANNFGWQQGPYPPSAGPQGNEGDAANQNLINEGFVQGNPYDGGTPIQAAPPQQSNPTLTPGENQTQPVSQPGSGATAVTPQGAVNQTNQQAGK